MRVNVGPNGLPRGPERPSAELRTAFRGEKNSLPRSSRPAHLPNRTAALHIYLTEQSLKEHLLCEVNVRGGCSVR